MLFEDNNRIDLTLFPKQKIKPGFKPDSLTILWLDKENLYRELPQSGDKDYHIKKPTEKEFLDTCNEFWWVSTYVVKGLMRNEIICSKQMLETVVRPMFMKVIEWKVGIENKFGVSPGKGSRFLKSHLSDDLYEKILHTYSGSEIKENWKSLLLMTELFQQTSNFVAGNLGFNIDKEDEQNTISYLKDQYEEYQK